LLPISDFSYFLRTGRRLPSASSLQIKYNHWHDTENGQFTFGGRGRYFGTASSATSELAASSKPPKLAQYQRNPRVRMGGNGGPPLQDPSTLEHAFPGVGRSPAGTIIGIADNFLDITGPAKALTTEFSLAYVRKIEREIRALDPSYIRPDSGQGGFPTTSEGQANLINRLRLDRAKLYYRKGDAGPLQVETLRFIQGRVDAEYAIGMKLLRAGKLPLRLSPAEALGNYIDRQVRKQLRDFQTNNGISSAHDFDTQVNGRAYNTPASRFSVPDSRVGKIAFDWSLTAKSLSTAQVQNFFNADFRPNAVVIVRPRQMGPNSTYIIIRPSGR